MNPSRSRSSDLVNFGFRGMGRTQVRQAAKTHTMGMMPLLCHLSLTILLRKNTTGYPSRTRINQGIPEQHKGKTYYGGRHPGIPVPVGR